MVWILLGVVALAATAGVLIAVVRYIEWYVKTDDVDDDE